MIPSMNPDGPKPVPTSSDFAIIRRGRPGDVAVTGAGREERSRGRYFEDAHAARCAPDCTRIVSHYQDVEAAPPYAHGDAPKPRRYADTVAKRLSEGPPWLVPACHSAIHTAGQRGPPCIPLLLNHVS